MKCQKNKFLLTRKEAYLNCAYMSPQLKKVENVGRKGLAMKRKPHKIAPEDFFKDGEEVRKQFSKLINSSEPLRSVLIPSVSYGMGTVTKNVSIKKGENIIVLGDQFPSNVYPWMRVCKENDAILKTVKAPDTLENRGKKWNAEIISAIDEKTKVVAISHVHWADGTLFDLEAIRVATSQVGALLVIDGTQSIGALPFDVEKIKPDALVCASYKWLLGPYGIGMAYFGSAFDNGIPLEENWINRKNSEDFANLVNYQKEYREGALRYEVGEHSNPILTPMLLQALKQLNHWQPDFIQEYCKKLVSESLAEIQELGLFVEKESYRSHHLFGIKYPADKLDALQKSFKQNKVKISIRGEFIRVSPNVYNDELDMKKLVRSIKQVF